MQNASFIHFFFLGAAIVLEILSNIFLKYSDGFRRKGLGILSIIFVLAAFSALAQSVRGIDLSIAYAVWGAFGIMATVAIGRILFNEYFKKSGYIGLLLLLLGLGLLKFS